MKKRTNITIHPDLYKKARQLMKLEDFADFSGFVEHLIRSKWQAQGGDLREEPTPYRISPKRQRQAV